MTARVVRGRWGGQALRRAWVALRFSSHTSEGSQGAGREGLTTPPAPPPRLEESCPSRKGLEAEPQNVLWKPGRMTPPTAPRGAGGAGAISSLGAAINLLCDFEQVALLLWARVASSVD